MLDAGGLEAFQVVGPGAPLFERGGLEALADLPAAPAPLVPRRVGVGEDLVAEVEHGVGAGLRAHLADAVPAAGAQQEIEGGPGGPGSSENLATIRDRVARPP